MNMCDMKEIALTELQKLCEEQSIKYNTIDVMVDKSYWMSFDPNTEEPVAEFVDFTAKVDNFSVKFARLHRELYKLSYNEFNIWLERFYNPMLREAKREQLILELAGVK